MCFVIKLHRSTALFDFLMSNKCKQLDVQDKEVLSNFYDQSLNGAVIFKIYFLKGLSVFVFIAERVQVDFSPCKMCPAKDNGVIYCLNLSFY